MLEEVSFKAPEETGADIIDAPYVREKLEAIVKDADLTNYIL